MDKQSLLEKIKASEHLTPDERAYLTNLINTKKKYGLVWEDKPEDAEELLRTHLPVLMEVVEKRIVASPNPSEGGEKETPSQLAPIATPPQPSPKEREQDHSAQTRQAELFDVEESTSNNIDTASFSPPLEGLGEVAPNHILIEGDNLHALTALTFTHEGKVDVMYFDPPYNTKNKDFKYNDTYVDFEDSFRHSKWLSFMEKRLKIAKRLLSDKGVVFISIDDNEQAQLKMLCDEVFGVENFIGLLPTIMNLKGNQDQFCFAGTHEYTFVYTKSKSYFTPNSFNYDLEELEEWDQDDIGLYKKGASLRATGAESNRVDRPLMFYPILIDKTNNASTITEEEHNLIYDKSTKEFNDIHLSELIINYQKNGFEVLLPKVDTNNYGRWRWGFNKNTIKRLEYDVIVTRTKNGISLNKKQRPDLGELPSKKPKSIFYKPEYSSGNGTAQLKDIFENKLFNNPKPIDLIFDLITIGSGKNSTILDFFAGSGTTLHATMQLNAEDGGNRQCILVTNNENNICEEVTYVRNKRVIEGYTNAKGVQVAGLANNNLRYYRTEFVGSTKTEQNKRQLTQASTDLLCIKEDCYTEITEDKGLNPLQCRIFTNDTGKYMAVVYHSRTQLEVYAQLIGVIKSLENRTEKVKLYAFSPEKETLIDDFIEIEELIEAVPLPEAIYNAYRATFRTLKLDKQSRRD